MESVVVGPGVLAHALDAQGFALGLGYFALSGLASTVQVSTQRIEHNGVLPESSIEGLTGECASISPVGTKCR